MANPNIKNLTSLSYDIDIKGLTTGNTTIVGAVATGQVDVIDKLTLTNITSGMVSVTLTRGSSVYLQSIQVQGFTSEQIDGPIVVKEGTMLLGNASAVSSINAFADKRSMT